MYHVTAIGELLIDFTPSGTNAQGAALFARNPGGAPANVLAMNARLGGKTAFIGKVGQDAFGRFLKQTLQENHIGTKGLVMDAAVNTTLAIVQLDEKGDRTFSFYRKPGADVMLTFDEIPRELLCDCGIFHFGSVSLTDEPARSATLQAVQAAKENGRIISFDPNFRPFLWPEAEKAVSEIKGALKYADILKVSEEEMELLTGKTDLEEGAKLLAAQGPQLIFVSRGPKGAFFFGPGASGTTPAYNVKTIDTTGAGDAFFGAILYRLSGKTRAELCALDADELREITAFGNAAGSLTTAQYGAIPAMPALAEIEDCMKNAPVCL